MRKRAAAIEDELSQRMDVSPADGKKALAQLDDALPADTALVDFALYQPVLWGSEQLRCGPLHYARTSFARASHRSASISVAPPR